MSLKKLPVYKTAVYIFIALCSYSLLNTTPAVAYHASDCSDVYTSLSSFVTTGVNNNKVFYQRAMNETGVPWEMLAAIHYRETNFSHTNPSNGQGIFQFVNGEGGPYPPGPVSDDEFYRQLKYMANKLQSDYVWRNSPNPAAVNRRQLVSNEQDYSLVKNTLYSYNGRATVYADQAAHFGYDKSTRPYEGSPYVMNRFDCPRARMGIITQDYGSIDSTDTRYGTFTLFIRLRSEVVWRELQGPYYASYSSQSPYTTLDPGQKTTVFISYQNGGANDWYDDTSLSRTPTGTKPIHLATNRPLNRISGLAADTWPSANRPAVNFSAVYESDGTTLAADQHVVKYGQIAKFQFELSAKANTLADTYQEYFIPVAEGSSGSFNDPWTFLQVSVNVKQALQWNSQGSYPSLYPTESEQTFMSYKNTGNGNLYDDQGLSKAPPGTNPVHFATGSPLNRSSVFGLLWPSPNRANLNFSAVYESDGATLAADQHVLKPGQIVKFAFNMKAPVGQSAGIYREYLRPILEGTSDGYFPDEGAFLDVNVISTPVISYTANVGQLNTIANRPSDTSLSIRNDGNVNVAADAQLYVSNGGAFKAPSWLNDGVITTVGSALAPGQSKTINFTVLDPDATAITNTKLDLSFKQANSSIPGSDVQLPIIIAPRDYKSSYYSQAAYPTFTQGQTASVFLAYKNLGNQVWYDSTSISSATTRNAFPINLATSEPLNRSSLFARNWPSANRPAVNFSAVYESDGATLAADQHVAQPGQIIKYTFDVTPSYQLSPGIYREYFRPIAEGSYDGYLNNPGTFLDMNVLKQTFVATYVSQSAYPAISSGQTASVFLTYRNDGSAPWFDNTSLPSAPTQLKPVHLSTSRALNRISAFASSWPSTNRPAVNFTSIYKSDGVTLTDNQHVVQPGEVVKFQFNVAAGSSPIGTYREFFQPIVEGTFDGLFPDPWTFLDIKIQ